MKTISLNNLKTSLSVRETLSVKELCHVKGGGEDIRRKSNTPSGSGGN